MFGLFQKKTFEESLREHKASLRKSVREIERETTTLERQEKELEKNIKNEASRGHMASVKILAKDLVRIREHIEKFSEMRSHLQAISMRLQTIKSNKAMTDSMGKVSKVMKEMNSQMSVPALEKVMREFMKENNTMRFSEEMMTETMDQAFETGDEETEEQIIEQVLLGLGIDQAAMMANNTTGNMKPLIPDNSSTYEKDLEARIKNLNS